MRVKLVFEIIFFSSFSVELDFKILKENLKKMKTKKGALHFLLCFAFFIKV